MSDPRPDPPRDASPPAAGFAPDRLDGWKEIAAYLRRSVRTVQRWEDQFGLPVHRINAGQSESVYGVPAEFDAWLLQSAAARAAHDANHGRHAHGEADGTGVEPGGLPVEIDRGVRPPEPHPGRRLGWLAAAITAVTVLVAFSLGWQRPYFGGPAYGAPSAAARAALPGPPASLAVDGRSLIVRDRAGHEDGRHVFEAALDDMVPPGDLHRLTAIADLDGDGARDVVAAVTAAGVQSVFVLKADGTERMRWRPGRTVRFGTSAALGPGLVFTQVWPAVPSDGTFYAAGHVPIEFASVLVHLDLDGRVLHEYWSNGYITAFARLDVNTGTRWFVGAVHNETGGASLAVFDGPPHGSAPARAAKYRCVDCPPGSPAEYYVFPRSRMQQHVGYCASVTHVEADLSGGALVRVQISGVAPPAEPEVAHYLMGGDLHVRRATVGDSFPGVVDRLIAQRWLGLSAADRYRGVGDLFPVLQWNAAQRRFDALPLPEGVAQPDRASGTRWPGV